LVKDSAGSRTVAIEMEHSLVALSLSNTLGGKAVAAKKRLGGV
jgi:hypothetical protein